MKIYQLDVRNRETGLWQCYWLSSDRLLRKQQRHVYCQPWCDRTEKMRIQILNVPDGKFDFLEFFHKQGFVRTPETMEKLHGG